jgi:NADH dehydrogenase/NADH:ubiquinone oxidoreductase subunit G
MKIHTHSPKVLETRKVIVELLLASHPDACIVCDKGNSCELRAIATDLEIGLPRFKLTKRFYPIEDANPWIIRDLTKCVLCQRCIRACREIKKEGLLAVAYRGFDSKIVVDNDIDLDKPVCLDCDICVSICPTGALSKKETRVLVHEGEA